MITIFTKYFIGGIISYGLKIFLTYIAVTFFDVWYFFAYIVALAVVILVNFFINSFFIFKVNDAKANRIVKYLISIVVFNVLDAMLVVWLTDYMSLYYLASITISTIFIFLVKFFVYRYVIFNNDSGQSNASVNQATFSSPLSLKEYGRVYLKTIERDVVGKYFKPEMSILDLGCGSGRTTKSLYDIGCINLIGVDVSDDLIDQAKKLHSNIDFRVGDACRLEFSDNMFDLVFFSFNGIDYIHPKSDRLKAISEINRVLKSGGLLVYSSHNAFNIPRTKLSVKTFIGSIINLRILTSYRLEKNPLGDLITYFGNPYSEIKIAQKLGFEFVDIFGLGCVKNSKNKLWLSLFSKHIMYVFRKK